MDELTTEDLPWLSDYIFYIFKSPSWAVPIANFVDERCIIFDDEEENKFEYTSCHNEFKALVDGLLAAHLLELSITPEHFENFCRTGLPEQSQLHTLLVEQLLGVEDFLMFKAMMTKRNMDLFREAWSRMEAEKQEEERLRMEYGASAPDPEPMEASPAPCPEGGAQDSGPSGGDDWKLYEDQMSKVLKSSEEEAQHLELQKKCEEAELERVIALSLQAEEERVRQMAEEEEQIRQVCTASEAVPEQPAAVEAAHVPVAEVHEQPPATCDVFQPQPEPVAHPSVAFPVPVPAPLEPEPDVYANEDVQEVMAPIAEQQPPVAPAEQDAAPVVVPAPPPPPPPPALPRVVRLEPLAAKPTALPTLPALSPSPTGSFQLEQKKYETAVQRARAENVAASAKSFAVVASPPPVPMVFGGPGVAPGPTVPPPPSGPTEEERHRRAEHLKRHRQMLLDKRNQERERQLGEFNQHRGRTKHDAAAVPPPPPPVADGRGLAAELSGVPPAGPTEQQQVEEAQAAAKQMRQALTMQLRQTLTKQMPNAAVNMDEQLAQLEELRLR